MGRPWDETEWSCWDLVRHVMHFFGHDDIADFPGTIANNPRLLIKAFQEGEERLRWTKIPLPEHGCGVLMARNDGGRGNEVHAGVHVVLDKPYFLHVDKPHGTVVDTQAELHTRGWKTLNFYRRS